MPTQIRRRSFLWAADRSTARCGLPEGLARTPKRPARVTGRAGPPLLFGLAPRGVYRAADITARAVGSYPTVSPLPSAAIERTRRRFGLQLIIDSRCAGGLFSVALSVTQRPHSRTLDPLALPGALPCGVRTFLQPIPLQESSSDRPARSLPAIIAHRVMCSLHTLGSPMRMNRVCEGLKCGVPEVA